MALSDITPEDIRNYDAKGFTAIQDDKIQFHIERAIRETETIHDGRVSTLDIVDGNEEDFTELLAAHRVQLIEGGDAQSESSAGGDASYSIVQGNVESRLAQTKWGRQALEYLRNDQSIGVVRHG